MIHPPLKTFIIYARADTSYKDELLNHLHLFVDNGWIAKWVDSDLLAGEDWEKRIENELDAAHLVLMLVSADALRSEFIRKKELKTALEKKRSGSARVVPILVRDCYWEAHPDLSPIQLLPKDENGRIKGVAGWLSHDTAWTQCLRELKKLIDEIHAEIEKSVSEQAAKDALETKKQQETAEKNEKARNRRDEATWKKIQESLEASEDPEHKIAILESYVDDDTLLNYRTEAAEQIEDIQAELAAAIKVEKAKAEAARKKREEEEAQKKRKEEEERVEREKAQMAEAIRKKREAEAAEQKRKAEEEARKKSAPTMVFVKGGTYTMGSPEDEEGRYDDEVQHLMTVSNFEIGKYPVTQKFWTEIMGNNPSHFKGDNLPVEKVSWDDTQAFLKKLNARFPGKNYRLPTEAEWEYAARGGALSNGFKYAGSDNLNEVGWFWENSGDKPLSGEWDAIKIVANNCRTRAVSYKKANELGIYDMSGNVWEWCADWYRDYPKNPPKDYAGPASGTGRVLRGGSWNYGAGDCRVSNRDGRDPVHRGFSFGFRVASSPPQ